MTVFVFGNAALEQDSLPLRILPDLETKFPSISFQTLDPNEEWDVPKEMIVIDTVMGIKDITVFDVLEQFSAAPRVSLHDFDAYANLRLLSKLGKLKNIKIIGVPADIDRNNAILQICAIMKRWSN